MKEPTYEFDGKPMTVREVQAACRIYSRWFVHKALKAGARTIADLHAHWAASQKRLVAGHKSNSPWRKGFATPLSPRKAG